MHKIEGVEAFAEDGSHHNNLDNVYVEINNPPWELLQIVRYLRVELQTVTGDNEIIIRSQEDLNRIILHKIHNEGKDKIKQYEIDSKTVSYKHKGKKLKFSDSESSSGVNVCSHRSRYKYTSESSESDRKPRKMKYKPYEEISGEFKKIKPPMFNGEVEKGE